MIDRLPTAIRGEVRRRILGLWRPPMLARKLPTGPLTIAVFRPDHIGDIVLAAPAVDRLVASFPGSKIDLYVGPWSADVARGIRGVEVKVLRFPGFQRENRPKLWEPYRQLDTEARAIRSDGYDAAIIFRFDHFWGAMLAARSEIPIRIGFDQSDTLPFLTDSIPHEPGAHETEQNLRLIDFAVSRLGGRVSGFPARKPELTFAPAPIPTLTPGRFAVFHPGAGAPVKRWRPEGFASVARWLRRAKGIGVVITGGPSEEALVQTLRAVVGPEAQTATGLRIPELAELLKRAELVLGPDSGVLHIASSVGTPTVRLYGPVDHGAFGPFRDEQSEVIVSDLPCVPCNRLDYRQDKVHLHPCVQSIEVARVIEAAERILSRTRK